jgi:hypothetical protein
MDLLIKAKDWYIYPFDLNFNRNFRKLQFKLPSGRVLYQVDEGDFGEDTASATSPDCLDRGEECLREWN